MFQLLLIVSYFASVIRHIFYLVPLYIEKRTPLGTSNIDPNLFTILVISPDKQNKR